MHVLSGKEIDLAQTEFMPSARMAPDYTRRKKWQRSVSRPLFDDLYTPSARMLICLWLLPGEAVLTGELHLIMIIVRPGISVYSLG